MLGINDVEYDIKMPAAGIDNRSSEGSHCLINDLPRELLLKIFKTCKDVETEIFEKNRRRRYGTPMEFGYPRFNYERCQKERILPFELLASHVCQFWRDLVLSDPSFWTTLNFDEPMPFLKTQAYIFRSRESPLDISMKVSEPNMDPFALSAGISLRKQPNPELSSNVQNTLNLIIPHLHRWQSFNLATTKYEYMRDILLRLSTLSSAPLLKTLSLESKYLDIFRRTAIIPFGGQTPLLVKFQLSRIQLTWQDSLGMFNNLQSLILSRCGEWDLPMPFSLFHQMLGGLGSARLEELVLQDLLLEQPVDSIFSSKIMLPNLRTLSLGTKFLQGAAIFLDTVNAPNLRELRLSRFITRNRHSIDEISRGLLRPLNMAGDTILSPVEKLYLSFDFLDEAVTIQIFIQLNQLKNLIINFNDVEWKGDIRISLLSGYIPGPTGSMTSRTPVTIVCPQLEGLVAITRDYDAEDFESVRSEFVKARKAMGYPLKRTAFKPSDLMNFGSDEREFLEQNLSGVI